MLSFLPDGWRLAFGTLTAIPVPPPRDINADAARVAMLAGWVAVLPVTLVASVVGWALLHAGVPALASGLMVVGLVQLGTRGLHADGLADTIDGLSASWDRDRALDIMRRGDVGPLGATALVVVLGLQASLVGEVLARPAGWVAAGLALALGRLALTLGTMSGVPAARPEGLGAAVASVVPRWAVAAVWGLGLLLLIAVMLGVGGPWWGAVVGIALGLLGAGVVLRMCIRKLGGITGDVLGAMVEIACVGLLLGL